MSTRYAAIASVMIALTLVVGCERAGSIAALVPSTGTDVPSTDTPAPPAQPTTPAPIATETPVAQLSVPDVAAGLENLPLNDFFEESYKKDQLIEAYEAILDEVDERLDVAFDIRPRAEVVVIGGPFGGYYVAGSSDGSRPGAFHVATGGSWATKYRMASLAYHEAIPGHHFQIATTQELDLPMFRTDVFFNGYGEGWALYAERLAWEMGLYEENPYGNVGRLNFELLRAVRLVVDTGIHAMRWTREEANEYMAEALGAPSGSGPLYHPARPGHGVQDRHAQNPRVAPEGDGSVGRSV